MIYCSWHLRLTNFVKAMSTRIASSDPVQHNHNMGETPNSSIRGKPSPPRPFLSDGTVVTCICMGQRVLKYEPKWFLVPWRDR